MSKLRQGWIENGVGYIPLTQGQVAFVDPEDVGWLRAYDWYASSWARNHQTLDNRRFNLRACTHAENSKNGLISLNNKTGFKGVSFEAFTGRYKAQITVNYKMMNLGRYDTPEEAYQIYLKAAEEFHGEFACDGEKK